MSGSAALVGSYGMQAVIDDTNAIYVSDDTPNTEPRYRARFYLDPNSATITGGVIPVFFGYSGANVAVRLELYYSGGSYKIRGRVLKDDGSWIYGSYVSISDAPHYIEFDWQAASAGGANDGYLSVWMDGGQVTNLSGVDNDTHRIESARLGVPGALTAGSTGTLFFDAFESRRSSTIGPQGGLRGFELGKVMRKGGLAKGMAVRGKQARLALVGEGELTDYLFAGERYEDYKCDS